jgi:hypothetical protein
MRQPLSSLIVLLALVAPASAHDHWISMESLRDPVTEEWCCNSGDCFEESQNIEAVEGGFLIRDTREIIPRARVIWRSPGGWWRCRYTSGERAGKTRCLIGPPQGT